MTATADGALLVNVHVGGIPRSVDGGLTFEPTLAVDDDVHQVLAHPTRGEIAVAAASVGLCRSRDGGETWHSTTDGMEMTYPRGVAILGDDVLVTVSDGPWSDRSAVYRASVDGGPVEKVTGGLPEYLSGNIDTRCIASDGTKVALVDGDGDVWLSSEGCDAFARIAESIAGVTGWRSPDRGVTPHYAVRFLPATAIGDGMSHTAGIGVVDRRVVVPRTFAWSGEPQGDRLRWFAAGLREVMLDQGYTEVDAPGPDVAVVLHFVDPDAAAPYRRKNAPTFVVALAELDAPPADMLRTGYPLLVRGLANLCVMVSPSGDGPSPQFVTLEQGTYAIDTGDRRRSVLLQERVLARRAAGVVAARDRQRVHHRPARRAARRRRRDPPDHAAPASASRRSTCSRRRSRSRRSSPTATCAT